MVVKVCGSRPLGLSLSLSLPVSLSLYWKQASLLVTRNKRCILFLNETLILPPPSSLFTTLLSFPFSILILFFLRESRNGDCNFMANASRHFNCDFYLAGRQIKRDRKLEKETEIEKNTEKDFVEKLKSGF